MSRWGAGSLHARNYTIIGVVRNSVANAFGEPPTPVLYFSYRDSPLASGELHVKTVPGSETALTPALRQAMGEIDTEVPLFNVRTLSDHVETNLFLRRIPARMFVAIGPLLLFLVALGIYTVAAYTASLRRTEVCVRLAIGAVPSQIVRQFVRENLVVISIGAGIGWAMAFWLSVRYVPASMDVSLFVAVPALLLAVATVACWFPARRASRMDPTVALRPE